MNILKTSVLTAIATAARLLSGFIVMKLVAVKAGPEGVAQLGQFMSLTALLVVFAGGGIGPGVVKYLAEFKADDSRVKSLLQSALTFTLIASLVMCLSVLSLSWLLAEWLFGSDDFQWLIIILSFAQIFVALHNLIISIVNGMMDVKRLASIHICGAAVGVLLPILLGYFYALQGVLLAFLLAQASLVLISFYVYKESSYFSWAHFGWLIRRDDFTRLARFSLMTLTSALLAPVVQIAVRNHLAHNFTWEDVGYWQAVSKVSEAYLLFISMAISVYYLPKLSGLIERSQLLNEIKLACIFLIPLVSAFAFAIYMSRDVITVLLFSSSFESSNFLYAPQLVGDVFKIASFVFSYMMLAKAMTRVYIYSEIFFSMTYCLLVYTLTHIYGLIGAMYAFAVNYFIYMIFSVIVVALFIRNIPCQKSA